jgi:hypothetical protein
VSGFVAALSLGNLRTVNEEIPARNCPTCGDPYIGGPGCSMGECAATCGGHESGDCTDRCWNPLAYDGEEPNDA